MTTLQQIDTLNLDKTLKDILDRAVDNYTNAISTEKHTKDIAKDSELIKGVVRTDVKSFNARGDEDIFILQLLNPYYDWEKIVKDIVENEKQYL